MSRYVISDIVSLMPDYGSEGGNNTTIYTVTGNKYSDRRSLRTVLSRVAAHFGKTPLLLRKAYGKGLGCTLSAPMPLRHDLILVPIKVREPRFRQDGATGYVNCMAVTGVDRKKDLTDEERARLGEHAEKACCFLRLSGGVIIPSYLSENSTLKRLRNGQLASFEHLIRQLKSSGDSDNSGGTSGCPCQKRPPSCPLHPEQENNSTSYNSITPLTLEQLLLELRRRGKN